MAAVGCSNYCSNAVSTCEKTAYCYTSSLASVEVANDDVTLAIASFMALSIGVKQRLEEAPREDATD